MIQLDDTQLARIMRHASRQRRAQCLGPLNAALQRCEIDGVARVAAFLAQLAHESGELQFLEELWGPTPAQQRYEPPGRLAERLGNTQPGDGARFKGRGPIQITGRANYARYGKLLGLDLQAQPELAAQPDKGFLIAGEFWRRNGLNALADAGDFDAITQRINGGQNGAAERRRLHALALQVLAGDAPGPAAAVARKAARRDAATAPRLPRLVRGHEAIAALRDEAAAGPPARAPNTGRTGQAARANAAAAQPRRRKTVPPDTSPARSLDARPDTLDFRDRMYEPTLVEVPTHVALGEYLEHGVPILDQGSEGACTGFGLAAVANYLLMRRRVLPDATPVSPRMLYQLARRYDEWPGEDYTGSSARGAMKGWHKHGVCCERLYPYTADEEARGLNDARTADALQRPLGSYFRVNHKDLVAMHAALAEVGILYATCTVHAGWQAVGADGVIVQSPEVLGGHAFALVAYDDQGFWLQNSWGPSWGRGGFARISYDDWLAHGTDVWVARLGAPVTLARLESAAAVHAKSAAQSNAYSYVELRPHIVSVGNDGRLSAGGDYGSTPAELARVFEEDMPRAMQGWAVPRVLLYAHGGLVSEQAAVQRLAEYRPLLLGRQVYPLAFVWRTDFWTTLTNILKDAVGRRRSEGLIDDAKDFMLDRLDDALEPLARSLGGRLMWSQMKQNALAASESNGANVGAAVRVADHLRALADRLQGLQLHLVGHSAGSILLAPQLALLAARQLAVQTCTLWAPACTVQLFRSHYLPALQARQVREFALFLLSDKAEQDDHCARIYNKSLLYLVSHAFEDEARIPLVPGRAGVPLLGMERWFDAPLRAELAGVGADVVIAPNTEPEDSFVASGATAHGAFDDDRRTVASTFGRIVAARGEGEGEAPAGARRGGKASRAKGKRAGPPRQPGAAGASGDRLFPRSDASLRERRQEIDQRTRGR